MTIEADPLRSTEDLAACERLQRRLLGEGAGAAVVGVPALRAIAAAGGLLLGVRADRVTRELCATAVSLTTTFEGFRGLFSLLFGVAQDARGKGVAVALRLAERRAALEAGVEVIRSWVDPLEGRESHILWNRAGAIGAAYERSALGDLSDRVHRGLATDRVLSEWWLRSPRTIALIDEGGSAAHLRVGLNEMVVLTRTTPGPSGQRVLGSIRAEAGATNVLIEIPEDIQELRDANPAEARRWRLCTREAFERLLAAGYLLVGLVHEGGRCFQLLEKTDRSSVLGRS
jgi:predicted GNAT superfamily acetyltransferase